MIMQGLEEQMQVVIQHKAKIYTAIQQYAILHWKLIIYSSSKERKLSDRIVKQSISLKVINGGS